MRDDNAAGGSLAVRDCREHAVRDQYGLCAYCEQEIAAHDALHCRIEHFHPKSDRTGTHNWALDWNNMLAVCDGGERTPAQKRTIHPLPANLSCDAHKNHALQSGGLPVDCEGRLLNPLDITAFPNLFVLDKGTGHLDADDAVCRAAPMPGNKQASTSELVRYTIKVLNLNCERLATKRRLLVVDIDQRKKRLRQKGIPPADMPRKLIARYFSAQWPEFFTTIRCCLGQAAEEYLQSVDYRG
jgi:uncharacterized protein (TIGR02646 family)